jgi:hypothetical protein
MMSCTSWATRNRSASTPCRIASALARTAVSCRSRMVNPRENGAITHAETGTTPSGPSGVPGAARWTSIASNAATATGSARSQGACLAALYTAIMKVPRMGP